MTKESRELLEEADSELDQAYKNIRILISDLRDESVSDRLRSILIQIDKAKQELEELFYPVSDVEMFELIVEGKRTIFNEANHV